MNSMVEVIVGGWPAAQSSGHHGCILIGTHIFVAYKRLSTVCPQLQYRNWLIDVSSTPPTVTVVRPWISFIWRQCLSSVTPKTKHTIVNNSINVVVVIWTEHSRGCDRRFFINVCVCVCGIYSFVQMRRIDRRRLPGNNRKKQLNSAETVRWKWINVTRTNSHYVLWSCHWCGARVLNAWLIAIQKYHI